MFARLLLRRGSTTEWANANPILELGEPGVDTTVNKIKIGDGVTNWNDLDWANRLDTSELGDIVIDNPQNTQILTYQNNKWVNTNNKSCASPSSVAGKIDTFINEVDNQFRFRSLIAGDGIGITTVDNNTIRISAIPLSLSNLTDVQFEEELLDGQVLQYANGNWINDKLDYNLLDNAPSIPQVLNDLNDVNTGTPLAGQVLKFDAVTNKWVASVITANAEWGSIIGSIYNQADLVTELAAKQAKITNDNKLSYNLLKDTPTIPSLEGYATESWVSAGFQTLITNDNKLSYNLLKDTPTIPSLTGYATETWTSTNFQTKLSSNNKLNPNYVNNLKTVATSGDYADLTNKPTIPSTINDLSNVNISEVSNNEILKYDSATSKWVNGVLSASVSWGNITGTLSNQTDLVSTFATKQDVIDASHKLSASYISGLATVATSGDYTDLSNKPTIPTTLNSLSNVTITSVGNNEILKYDSTTSKWVNGLVSWGNISGSLSNQTDLATEFATKQDVIDSNNKLSTSYISGLATVATSGSYADLTNKPTIPTALNSLSDVTITSAGNNNVLKYDSATSKWVNGTVSASVSWGGISGTLSNQTDLVSEFATKQDVIDDNNLLSVNLIDGLANVATSGDYTDLTNKPTIPTVNNATLTIQKNGTTVDTFTANASSNVTVNIVESVQSASSPLSITSNALSISQASNSTDGYLSSTDWNTFNGKAIPQIITIDNTTTPSVDISTAGHQIYQYTSALTSLTLTGNPSSTTYEAEFQFTTSSTFAFTATGLANKWLGISSPSFDVSTSYVIVIKNGYAVCSKVGA